MGYFDEDGKDGPEGPLAKVSDQLTSKRQPPNHPYSRHWASLASMQSFSYSSTRLFNDHMHIHPPHTHPSAQPPITSAHSHTQTPNHVHLSTCTNTHHICPPTHPSMCNHPSHTPTYTPTTHHISPPTHTHAPIHVHKYPSHTPTYTPTIPFPCRWRARRFQR